MTDLERLQVHEANSKHSLELHGQFSFLSLLEYCNPRSINLILF